MRARLAIDGKVDYNCRMSRLPKILVAVLLASVALQSACSRAVSNNTNSGVGAVNSATNANSVRSDVEELGVRVNMPFETEELVWKEFAAEKKIVAVMRFSPEDSQKIVAEAEKVKAASRVDVTSETWFPPELIAQADMTGDDRLAGSSYAANTFLIAPYNEGSLVRIDNTDYFVLQVVSK